MADETTTATNAQAAAPAPEKPARVQMPEQNGIRRPKPGTEIAKVWETAESLSDTLARPATRAEVKEAVGDTINPATFATQYARWTKFHNVSGAIKANREAERNAKQSERDAAKAEKQAERDAKKREKEAAREAAAAKAAEEKAAKQAEADRVAKEKADADAAAKAEADAKKAEEKRVKAEAAAAKKAAKAAAAQPEAAPAA